MQLAPLRDNRSKSQTATTKWVEAPTKGWNAKNDLSDMDELEAVVLDNLIVTERGVRLRPGKSEFATGLGSAVLALMEHAAPDGTASMFGATVGAIWDVTAGGAVGAADVTGLNSGQWQHTMFATTGGNYLVCCNGIDDVRNYDGTTWTAPAITNVTSGNLINVAVHMSRLWFTEKNTLKVWYLPTGAIAGAATSIDFGPLSRLGGH
ncbi:MAG: hypothetical protein ABL897_06690, partial [Hyphomicrobium sp.]